MMIKKFKSPIIFFAVAIVLCWSNAVGLENQNQALQTIPTKIERSLISSSFSGGPVFRQVFIDSFERADLIPWTTSGDTIWGIRDTLDTYGPQSPAVSGYRYAGYPDQDIAAYPDTTNPGFIIYLISPTIDITAWDSLYLSFNYWGDFEGAATNFDGGIVEISSDNGVTFVQIDSLAEGHLNPTYDAELAGTGQLDTAWAYCYTTNPNWISISSQDLITLGYASAGDQIKIRFTFAHDALAGGEGWFIDDVRIAETAPPDLQPPVIVHTPLPDTTDTLNPYTISATITDVGSGVDHDSVYLHYQIESGPIIDVQMDTVGTGSPDIYEADIPPQGYHTDIFYHITAADMVGNEATTLVYNFEVTNARTIIYDDGQPWYGASITTSGNGCFVQFKFSDVGIDSGLLHQAKFLFDGPIPFDLRVYTGTTGNPGAFIDSVAGLNSPGYQWYTVDITNLNIQTANPNGVVVGYIIGPNPDSLGLLRDSTLDYSYKMWDYVNNNWGHPTSGGDYMIRLKVIPITLIGVEENPGNLLPPLVFALGQSSSNPTRENVVIEYQLSTTQKVSLNVYNVSGRLVKQLVEAEEQAGTHKVSWNGRDQRGNPVASGVYFYQLKGENKRLTRKFIVTR
ncbi:T9SS type A sorting domain-containing protein [candidate division WOR-3 bacterium]|nr:T9SS type A sorting domain-containing protein [candidate division WOR-3 bacterium]